MSHCIARGLCASALCLALAAAPAESQACCFGHSQTTYRPWWGTYAPVAVPTPVAVAPAPCAACAPCQSCCPQTCSYVPQTCYRTMYESVPVTSYMPVTTADPCSGCPVTAMKPVTSYVQQARLVPYTTYRPVYTAAYAPAPTCSTCGTTAAYYAPVATGCSTCGTTAAYYAPVASGCSTCGAPAASGCSTCGATTATTFYPQQATYYQPAQPVAPSTCCAASAPAANYPAPVNPAPAMQAPQQGTYYQPAQPAAPSTCCAPNTPAANYPAPTNPAPTMQDPAMQAPEIPQSGLPTTMTPGPAGAGLAPRTFTPDNSNGNNGTLPLKQVIPADNNNDGTKDPQPQVLDPQNKTAASSMPIQRGYGYIPLARTARYETEEKEVPAAAPTVDDDGWRAVTH